MSYKLPWCLLKPYSNSPLQGINHNGDYLPIGSQIRITEDDEERITEDGQLRITE